MSLDWINPTTPDCAKCDALLRHPVFAHVFSGVDDQRTSVGELGAIAQKELNRYHNSGHRLFLPGNPVDKG
jgi:hypothetical protein